MKKLLFTIVTVLIMTISFPLFVHADNIADWIDEAVNSSIIGSGGGGTSSVPKGAVNSQQGWVFYIIDENGNLMTDTLCVYHTGSYITIEEIESSPNGTVKLASRYGGVTPSKKGDYSWPDATVGSNFSSNYSAVKSYFISNKGENLFNTIKEYFGDSAKEMFADTSHSYYFVMEPIYWHGLHKKGNGSQSLEDYKRAVSEYIRNTISVINATEKQIKELIKKYIKAHPYNAGSSFECIGYFCGTIYQGANWIKAQDKDYFIGVDICRRNYWPNNIKYSKDIAGVAAAPHDGRVSDSEIQNFGYGICAFWNKGLEEDDPNPSGLYLTKNWSDIYDISKAIPSSEMVNNKIDCSSLTAEEDFFDTKKEEKEYEKSVKYYWKENVITKVYGEYHYDSWYLTMEEAEHALTDLEASGWECEIREETGYFNLYKKDKDTEVTKTYYHDFSGGSSESETGTTRSYTFECDLMYQYITKTPSIYMWDSCEVGNGAFPDNHGEHTIYYDKNNVEKLPKAQLLMKLWNMGNGTPTIIDSLGILGAATDDGVVYKPSKDHFVWCKGLTDLGDQMVKEITRYDYEACPYTSEQQKSDLESKEKEITKKYAQQIQKNTKSRNDYLELSAPLIGTIKLTGEDDWYKWEKAGCNVTVKRGNITVQSLSKKSAADFGYKAPGVLREIVTEMRADRVIGQQTNQIPYDVENWDYPTGMHVMYHYILKPTAIGDEYYAGKEYYDFDSVNGVKWHNEALGETNLHGIIHQLLQGTLLDDIYNHIIKGGKLSHHVEGDGYPIRVHTPVESPVEITYYDGTYAYEETQLYASAINMGADHQLLLDKSYFVKWDDTHWYSAIYGDCDGYENIFNKYVKAKYLKFPFSVVYEGILYETNEDGYTDWFEVKEPSDPMMDYKSNDADWEHYESANHWQMTPFYIPSYAEERGAWGDNAYICCKVKAINVEGKYAGDHSDMSEYIINSDPQNYVAVFDCSIQVSGWIYDFTIVGANNKFLYTGEDFDSLLNNQYPMCPDRQEIKSGLKNRCGTKWIRFAREGGIYDNLDIHHTLPLMNGYSHVFSNMGELWRAEEFAFTLKTMANLSGPNDSIEIKPSYRYITADGEVYESKKGDFAYIKLSDDYLSWYVYNIKDDLDDADDEYIYEYQLNDRLFNESYYDEKDVNETDPDGNVHSDVHFADWVETSVANENSFNLTKQKYLYRTHKNYTISHISLDAKTRYIAGEYEQLEANLNKEYEDVVPYLFMGNDEDRFIHSIQQWNGQFKIPSRVRLVDTKDKEDFDFDDWIKNEIGTWSWNDYDLFMPFEARSKMIIHFDIIAYKDGRPYLVYDGGGYGNNMWITEDYQPDKPNPDPEDPTVPINPGDVVIVDWYKEIGDYYEPGLFNIN